jgi:hypothetical protein
VWDDEAQALLQDVRDDAAGLAMDDASYAAATPERLAAADGLHRFTAGASTAADQISVATRDDGVALAVRSRSGRCWVIDTSGALRDPADRVVRTGRLLGERPCTATAVAELTEEDF